MSSHPLLELLSSPWAIVPDRLLEIQTIYAAHLRGERADLEAVAARIGKPMKNEEQRYAVEQGVALIPLHGVLAKRANLFMDVSGGASHELFARDVSAALADPAVDAIFIDADTPGGTVNGTVQSAQAVRAARGVKPVAVWGNGLLASAGYWIASQADLVYAADDVTQVGSIGVVATHVDVSRAEQMLGRKTTEIVAGRYKRTASAYQPLTEEGRAEIQGEVDYLYSAFVEAVADARNTTVDDVLERMADGRTFIGRQAVDAGLVDGIATRADVFAQLLDRVPAKARTTIVLPTRRVAAVASKDPNMSQILLAAAVAMSATDFAVALGREHPDFAAALRGEGAQAERDRIAAVRAQSMPGHEALIEQLAADGKTTGPEAAVAVLNAERAVTAKRSADLAADAPKPLAAAASATGDDDAAKGDTKPVPPMASARAKADAIARVQAEAAKAGRTLGPVEALARVNAELAQA